MPLAAYHNVLQRTNAVACKSAFSINDMKAAFIAKAPGCDDTVESIGDTLDVFAIRIKEAFVVTGFDEPEQVVF